MSSFLTFVIFHGIIDLLDSFTSENVLLRVTPIVFGNDGRNGISYQLYEKR